MASNYTSAQIPNDSILDLNGRQIYLGNGFILPNAGDSIANTAETPLLVISNPSATKSLFFFSRKYVSDNNPVIVRSYLNPTLNVPGSATVPLNLRSNASTASVSVCYLGASITANGTLLGAVAASQYGLSQDILYVLDPGDKLLLTAQQAAAGTSLVIAECAWYET